MIVVSGMLDANGHDWCDPLFKWVAEDTKRQLSPEEAGWAVAGITRVECETSKGRVLGYDLK